MGKPKFLQAQWKDLLMLNYEVDPDVLKPYIPAGTILDLWQGKALVSMVGFMFLDTKVLGIKWPFHVNFEEINLRFYVKHFDGKEWKRGAVFVSEIVPKGIIAFVANNLYREHYRALPTRHSKTPAPNNATQFLYEWKLKGKWNKLGATVSNHLKNIEKGSAEEFIFEHYWGYNIWSAVKTMQYQVEHVSWQIAEVTDPVFEADVKELYGEAFEPFLKTKPFSAFFASGSDVNIRVGEMIVVDPALLK
ncbi:YqjF family protein [Mucilaginibacter sp.]|uniref:YqjF family protein n=1 Tax=Mucilaginibacter sp. TaxID=1882438 RepID=UPI003D124AFB